MSILKRRVKEIIGNAEKREQAIKDLHKLGVLLSMENLHLFHGRTTADDERFFVKGNFDNSDYIDGHYNNNAIPGIHASDLQIAKKYAEARSKQYYEKTSGFSVQKAASIYKLVSTQPNLFIFDVCKIYKLDELEPYLADTYKLTPYETAKLYAQKLSEKQENQLKSSISKLVCSYTIPQLMPKLFKNEKVSTKVLKDLNQICQKNKKNKEDAVVFDDDLKNYIQKKIKNDTTLAQITIDICGCINVHQILKENGDIGLLLSKMQSNFDSTCNQLLLLPGGDCLLNLDFFKEFLLKNNIIGVHQKIWISEVIGERNFDDYFIFDTSKVNTKQFVKKQKRQEEKEKKASTEEATSLTKVC